MSTISLARTASQLQSSCLLSWLRHPVSIASCCCDRYSCTSQCQLLQGSQADCSADLHLITLADFAPVTAATTSQGGISAAGSPMRVSYRPILRCAFGRRIQRSVLKAISQVAVFDPTREYSFTIGRAPSRPPL
jgi:hypothetical protein